MLPYFAPPFTCRSGVLPNFTFFLPKLPVECFLSNEDTVPGREFEECEDKGAPLPCRDAGTEIGMAGLNSLDPVDCVGEAVEKISSAALPLRS